MPQRTALLAMFLRKHYHLTCSFPALWLSTSLCYEWDKFLTFKALYELTPVDLSGFSLSYYLKLRLFPSGGPAHLQMALLLLSHSHQEGVSVSACEAVPTFSPSLLYSCSLLIVLWSGTPSWTRILRPPVVSDLLMSSSVPGAKVAVSDLKALLLPPALMYLTKETGRAGHRNLTQG